MTQRDGAGGRVHMLRATNCAVADYAFSDSTNPQRTYAGIDHPTKP
jgi:hypothetical protein